MAELNSTSLLSDANLEAYYRFNAGALTTDSSGDGETLTNNNTVGETSDGKFGYAADFGATNTNKYFSVASNLGIVGTGALSVSLWIKLSSEIGSGFYGLFDHVGGGTNYIQLYYDYNSGTRRLVLDNSGTTGTYNITLGTTNWYHLVITRSGVNQQAGLYIDTVSRISGTAQGATAGGASGRTVLGTGNSLGIFHSGLMDDVGIFSKVLSTDEINTLYQEGNPSGYIFTSY